MEPSPPASQPSPSTADASPFAALDASPSPSPGLAASPSPSAEPALRGPSNDIQPLVASGTLTVEVSPSSIAEPGGSVAVNVVVVNTSSSPATLTELADDSIGTLAGQGDCVVGGTIDAGAAYACAYPSTVSGNAGDSVTRTVTALLTDEVDATTAIASGGDSVTITDTPSSVVVEKSASPASQPEPGGPVTFSVRIENTSAADVVSIVALLDDVHGDLAGQGTCSVPQAIPAGGAYACAFSATVSGGAGASETDTVTASGRDDDGGPVSGSDSATVDLTDVPSSMTISKSADPSSLPEPGGPVDFMLVVTNTSSVDTITLADLVDDIHGDVTSVGGSVTATTCSAPQAITPGDTYACTFTATVSGDAGATEADTVTASATDDDGGPLTASDGASVSFTDVPPTMTLTKTADPGSLPEPGGLVSFSLAVTNTSPEALELTSARDDVYGDLDGKGDCALPQTIPAGGTWTCTAAGLVTGDAGDRRTDTITVGAQDDDGNRITGEAEASVTITDVLPAISATKRAQPAELAEPGGQAVFTIRVENPSPVEDVVLTSLVDDVYGDLSGQGTCLLPQTLTRGGGTYTCSFPGTLSGNAGDVQTDIITATGRDNEGNPATTTASADVTIVDVMPALALQKSAVPASRPEPGGAYSLVMSVSNGSAVEAVTLTSLVDDVLGDLDGQGDCSVPQVIAAGGTYECSIPRTLLGNAGASESDTVTAAAEDDEGNPVNATDGATFTITDVPPTFTLQKSASPSVIAEPGADVTFSVAITNDGPEPITLTTLVDDNYGDLDGVGTCAVPQVIPAGGMYTCSFVQFVENDAGETKIDIVSATLTDDDGNTVTKSDTASVETVDAPPSLDLEKSLLYPTALREPGGTAWYRVVIRNTGTEPFAVDSLEDEVDGNVTDLDGRGSCSVPQTIPPGGFYACSFPVSVTGDAGDLVEDTVTATATDNEGSSVGVSDDAQIGIIDVPPEIDLQKSADPASVGEPGGVVTFSIRVHNDSVEPVTLTSLSDDVYGDVADAGNPDLVSTDCAVPQVIPPQGSYTCQFEAGVLGSEGHLATDTVTGTAIDDDGNTATDSDGATVGVGTGGGAGTWVAKSATPASLPEPGGIFTFAVTVTSPGGAELQSLVDDIYGDLDGQGDCSLPQAIPAGGSYSCSFPATFTGDPGETQTDLVAATGVEDGGARFLRYAAATVAITDILPALTVSKQATPNPIDEPGGLVTYTIEVTNTTAEAAFLTTLVDDVYGDLNGLGTCVADGLVPIAPGATYACAFEGAVTGNAGELATDLVLAVLTDDDGNSAVQIAQEDVLIADVPPAVTLSKTPTPATLPEPGGPVSFRVVVTNPSPEPIRVTSLVDDVYGDLSGRGSCVTPQTIQPGRTYTCSFPAPVTGNAGETATDTVTATAEDDDGNTTSDGASATVLLTPAAPRLSVTKAASPASVPEPGGDVIYSVTVTNTSGTTDPITVESLSDTIGGVTSVPPGLACSVAGGSVSAALPAGPGTVGRVHVPGPRRGQRRRRRARHLQSLRLRR